MTKSWEAFEMGVLREAYCIVVEIGCRPESIIQTAIPHQIGVSHQLPAYLPFHIVIANLVLSNGSGAFTANIQCCRLNHEVHDGVNGILHLNGLWFDAAAHGLWADTEIQPVFGQTG